MLTARLILFSSANIDSSGSFHLVPIKKALLRVLLLNLFCSCEKHPAVWRNSPTPSAQTLGAVCPQHLQNCFARDGIWVWLSKDSVQPFHQGRDQDGAGDEAELWSAPGDAALLLRASVSLVSLVIPDHRDGSVNYRHAINSLTFCCCNLSFNIHFSLKMWELFPDALTGLEQ